MLSPTSPPLLPLSRKSSDVTFLQARNNCPSCVYVNEVMWNGVAIEGVTIMCESALLVIFLTHPNDPFFHTGIKISWLEARLNSS
jgi:hypothetical protein